MRNQQFNPVGRIRFNGKTIKITLDSISSKTTKMILDSGYPAPFFCFTEDLKNVLNGTYLYAKIYIDKKAIHDREKRLQKTRQSFSIVFKDSS